MTESILDTSSDCEKEYKRLNKYGKESRCSNI